MKSWLTYNLSEGKSEIIIDGFIGESWWDESGNSSKRFNEALARMPAGPITVRINSEGGIIQDGLGIYNAIRARGNVTTRVDGYALSIASVIALAGKTVVSPKSSVWMIHNPWSATVGDATDHRRSADMLDKNRDAIVAIYSEKTGKEKEEIIKLMDEETWMTGEEAVAMKFADKEEGEATIKDMRNAKAFKRVPDYVKDMISRGAFAAQNGGILPPPEDANQNKHMDETKPKAEATLTAGTNTAELEARLAKAEAEAKSERAARIKDKVERACAARGVTTVEAWVTQCVANEGAFALLEAIPQNSATTVIQSARPARTLFDTLKSSKPGRERLDFAMENWDGLRQEASRLPVNVNTGTDDTSLIGSVLADQAILILQNRLAPLQAFTRDFSNEPMAPNRPVVIQKVTAGGTAQSSATSFEDTTNFVGTVTPITVTPVQLTAGGYMNQTEMNRGMRVALWAEKKAVEIAEKALNAVTTLITTANYTATPHVAAAAAFDGTDMRTLWGLIKKAPRKFAILDGEYYAKLLPSTREEWNVTEGGWPGWDGVYLNTYWTSATANTVGFVCDPQALAVVAGIPALSGNSGRAGLATSTFTVPGLNITVAQNSWFANSSRTDWFTYDICFGAAVLDGTAGLLIKSS